MEKQDRAARRIDTGPSPDGSGPGPQVTGGHDGIAPIRESVRSWALEAVVTAYGGDAYRLLTDLADLLSKRALPTSTALPSRRILSGRCPTVNGRRSPTSSARWPSTST